MSTADHLQVPRQHGLFQHHGIDLGDGTVAHYLEGQEILRSSIEEFCAGQFCKVIIHENAAPNNLTLRRAMSRIGEQRYNLLFNNCEHFATWCKTGIHHSDQISQWLKNTGIKGFSIKKGFPKSIFIAANTLLNQGFLDKTSQEKARQIINHLKKMKQALLHKLESTLEEIAYWQNLSTQGNEASKTNQSSSTLVLKGQELADQLNALESVEAQITKLLSETNTKN